LGAVGGLRRSGAPPFGPAPVIVQGPAHVPAPRGYLEMGWRPAHWARRLARGDCSVGIGILALIDGQRRGRTGSPGPPDRHRCGRLTAGPAESTRSTVWLVPAGVVVGIFCERSVHDSSPYEASAPLSCAPSGVPLLTPFPGTDGRLDSLFGRRRWCPCSLSRSLAGLLQSEKDLSGRIGRVARMRWKWPRRGLHWLTVASG
jgi:hypothetical protein